MQTLAQINKQIASLQKEAEAIKADERKGVIAKVRVIVGMHGLTSAEVFGARSAEAQTATQSASAQRANGSAPKKRATKMASPLAIKYRDDAGNTWVGRGKRPKWLQTALAGGKQLAEFLIS